jgi:hypothetical protein
VLGYRLPQREVGLHARVNQTYNYYQNLDGSHDPFIEEVVGRAASNTSIDEMY